MIQTYFIDIRASKELTQMDINKMTNGIFTMRMTQAVIPVSNIIIPCLRTSIVQKTK